MRYLRGTWGLLAGVLLAGAFAARASAQNADYVGASTCLGCHSDKDAFKKNVHAMGLKNVKSVDFEGSCEACHGPGSRHAGAAGDKADAGFATVRNPSKLGATEASALCLNCHEGSRRMHWKGSTHDMKQVSCVNCHSVHKHEVNHGRSPLLKAESPAQACYQCHAEKRAQIRKSGHMPLVEGKMGCTACHNPHGSPAEKMMAKKNIAETCFKCHQDKRGPYLWDHAPVREGDCTVCHDPHGSHNEKMLVTRSPLLCQRCHVGGRHPATAYGQAASDTSSNRLKYKGCVNCHVMVHGSNHPSGKWLNR